MKMLPRWILAVAVLGGAAAWLWSETRVTAHAEVTAPAKPADRERPVAVRGPDLRPASIAPALAAPTEADPFVETGDQLRARFAKESVDPAWANPTRAALEADFTKLGSKDTSVRSIDCRRTMCRIELVPTSPEAGAAYVQAWLRDRAFTGPGHMAQRDGVMEMFVGREGTELLAE